MNDHEHPTELEDRLIDRALSEALGGEAPPDLSERILAAANEQPTSTLGTKERAMNESQPTSRSQWKHRGLFAVAACLFVAVGLMVVTGQVDRLRLAKVEPPKQAEPPTAGTQIAPAPAEATNNIGLQGLTSDASSLPQQATDELMMMVKPHIIVEGEEKLVAGGSLARGRWAGQRYGRGLDIGGGAQVATRSPITEELAFGDQDGAWFYPMGRSQSGFEEFGKVSDTLGKNLLREQLETEIQEKHDRYLALSQKLDSAETPNASAVLGMLANEVRLIQQQIVEKKKELLENEVTKTLAVQQANSPTALENALQEEMAQDPMLQSFQQERFAVAQQLTQLKATTKGRSSPELKRLQEHLRSLDQQHQEYRITKESEVRNRLKTTPNDLLAQEISEYMLRRQRLEKDLAKLEEQYEKKMKEVQRRGQTSGTLAILRSEIQQLQDLHRRLETEQGRGPGDSGDQYTRIYENPFIEAEGERAVSTFSIDVDTASYANVRQFLMQSGQLPPPDAVRLEELINYFDYDYSGPTGDVPFAAHVEVAGSPWQPQHRLLRVGIKGREMERKERPQSNLVFLIDVSGSMDEPAKLPLLVEGMKLLTRQLSENDRVAIVVYASSEGLALPSTGGDRQQTILAALEQLRAGGSTAGGAGIELAYQVAQDNYIEGGVNRVILCTDGDFNVGVTSPGELQRMAEEKAKNTGVFLTVLGFGRGNLNDAMMEAISGKGNGNYHYIDNLTEARKVLVEEMAGTLVTIAKDVKIQIEFNPAQVAGYRLLGYENRMLRTEDFNDDRKDAGEIGAGHTVTALYEIVPAGKPVDTPEVEPLKYQQTEKPASGGAASDELLTLKVRYKQPDGDTSTKLEFPITDQGGSFAEATGEFQFASAVASFGMLLRNSKYQGNASYAAVLEIAEDGAKHDPHGYRAEFLQLVERARQLSGE
ncbi:MAG: von Willebrand factor type A domain-containing protein [Pirellulales bacterium]|nr:von Willebrand factor type A domain-containing protein [Pirellulales bacterium]